MTNILVTGGAGYIGSHTCKVLARAGFTPVTYDNLVTGHEWAVKWGPLEKGDIGDADRLANVIRKHQPSAIIHFAAFAYVGESMRDPAKYYRNNVVGTLTLLDVMRQCGIEKIIFSSSCATYGIPNAVPISEDAPQNPISPYGASKLMIERMLEDYRSAYGLKSVSLRYFNAAGADAEGELGEDHDPETHLIPLVLDVAAMRRPDITVFGNDYDTPDGTCIRDYIHVGDLADAHVLAMEAIDRTVTRGAYNLGSGIGISVAQLLQAARLVTGRTIRATPGARRPGDPAVLLAAAEAARKDIGWTPHRSTIENILKTAWRWTLRNEIARQAAVSSPGLLV